MIYDKEDLKSAFQRGCEKGATHMIIVVDRYPQPQEDFIIYVSGEENVHEVLDKYQKKDFYDVMEVYCLKMDMEEQLDEHRAFDTE